MLDKQNRLKKNRQFNFIYRNGQAKHTRFLSLVFSSSKLEDVKVGFSVSKKIGKSVVRNKVKRRLRAIVRSLLPCFSSHYNYIFIAKEGIDSLTFDEIKNEVILAMKKASLFNEKIC